MENTKETTSKEYIGYAVEAVDLSDNKLKVLIPALQPFITGKDIKPNESKLSIQLADEEGNPIDYEVASKNYFTAEYKSRSSNMSVPHISANERVKIWNNRDSDRYYWEPLGDDDYLRKTERRVFQVAADPKRVKELTPDNTYAIELNSIEGTRKIHIHTSNANGEKYVYEILANAEDNSLSVKDDDGNYFKINSPEKQVRMENNGGCFIDMTGGKMRLSAPESIDLDAPDIGNSATRFGVNANTTSFRSKSGGAGAINSTGNIKHKGEIDTTELVSGTSDLTKAKIGSCEIDTLQTSSCNKP